MNLSIPENFPQSGAFLLDKPKGPTSAQMVAKIKHHLRLKKVGHTGTLDPLATGLLPIMFGQATKLIPYLDSRHKIYWAKIRLGVRTETFDREGEVVEEKPAETDHARIIKGLEDWVGEREQIPPMFSAVKVDGVALYKLARKGKTIERKSRKIEIFAVNDIKIDSPHVEVVLHCSRGTYLRALADELGQQLGCGACLWELKRLGSDGFLFEDSLTYNACEEMSWEPEQLGATLKKPNQILSWPCIRCDGPMEDRLRNGQPVWLRQVPEGDNVQACNLRGDLVALCEPMGDDHRMWKPLRVILPD